MTRREGSEPDAPATEVRGQPDLAAADGKRVVAFGTYRALRLPASARPGSPLVDTARACLELADGHRLALGTHAESTRPPEERASFDGRAARVTAILARHAQLWGTPEECAIVMDALTAIEAIERA